MSHQPPDPPALPPGPSDPSGRGRHRKGKPGSDGALKRTVVRPARPSPDPVDSAFVANRLTALTHDLANLLEGSLRVVSQARRTLDQAEAHPEVACDQAIDRAAVGLAPPTPALTELGRRLDTLQAAMAQMAELVRGAMMSMSGVVLGSRLPFGAASSLADAITHAVEVMRPLAEDRCIRLDLALSPELDTASAGPMYTVVVNGVRNAIEAIERRGSPIGGVVSVCGRMDTGKSGRAVIIEITDDGVGPPRPGGDRAGDVFRPGFTTKPGGSGIGLSMSMDVVQQLGGVIELLPRSKSIAGAVLRVCYPAPKPIDPSQHS